MFVELQLIRIVLVDVHFFNTHRVLVRRNKETSCKSFGCHSVAKEGADDARQSRRGRSQEGFTRKEVRRQASYQDKTEVMLQGARVQFVILKSGPSFMYTLGTGLSGGMPQ